MRNISSEFVDEKFSELRDVAKEEEMLLSGGKFLVVSTPRLTGIAMYMNDAPSDVGEVADLASRSTSAFEHALNGEPFPRKMKEPHVKKIDEILSELFYSVHDNNPEKIYLCVNLYGNNAVISTLSKDEIDKWHTLLVRENKLKLAPSDPSTFHYTARQLCMKLTSSLLSRPKSDAPYR